MNRTIFLSIGVISGPSLLLVDSAVKGAALLMMAVAIVAILRRDSAATRHLVLLLTMVALVAVPVLSALLPQWRVLPEWANIAPAPAVVATIPPAIARPAVDAAHLANNAESDEVESPTATAVGPAAVLEGATIPSMPPDAPAPAVWSWNWLNVLPLVWAIGFGVLMLRLMAARWMLWNSERQATIIGSSTLTLPSPWGRGLGEGSSTRDPLLRDLEAVCRQLAIARPVTLLVHPDKTIPVVWGILRWRLLLPAAARNWSGAQLRSVLLHELAHIKRRDTIAQLLTQVACALHWFNPLVWFAAWRQSVERERACDDLVLASGVRPSDYAGHLLDVVTGRSPVRWTQSCGLAMARQSSLEGRLALVLSKNLNRRRVPVALAASAFAIAAGIALPIALLGAMDERPGEQQKEKQKPAAANMKPKNENAQAGEQPKAKAEQPAAKKDQKKGEEKQSQPKQQPGKSDHERIVGVWVVVNDDSNCKGEPWWISKDKILMGDPTHYYPLITLYYRLDAGKDPKQIDLSGQPNGPPHRKGIYVLDGDELRLCLASLGKDRPAAFPKKPAPGVVLILHRQKPAGEQAKAKEQQPAANLKPKNETAQWLFGQWQNHTRTDGKIPGALLGQLALNIDLFLSQYPDDKNGPALAALRPRIDASKDWTQADAVALLDDITANSTAPVGWTNLKLTLAEMRNFKKGQPLPAELKTADWGIPEANGLRAAWLLEPIAKEYALGTVLKARVLFHNTGKEPVVFATETWHQGDEHKARDAKGVEIKVSRSFRTGLTPKVAYRLAPGEYCEVMGQNIGIGAGGTDIPAKAGDEITLTHVVDATVGARFSKPEVWKKGIAARVEREGPLPKAAADREQLIRRVTLDVFGVAASAEEIAAFVGDNTPDALAKLTARLQAKPRLEPWAGRLPTGETKFRVTVAAPNPKPDAPALQAKAAKSDQERIVGNWFIMNDDSMRKGETWVISENRILMYAKHLGAIANLYFHRLDAGKDPKQIDITVTRVKGQVIGVIKGIYVLDGDELRLCLAGMGRDRPAAFPKKPAPGEVLVLQRATSGATPPKATEAKPVQSDQERIVGSWVIVNEDSKRKGEPWIINKDKLFMHANSFNYGNYYGYWINPGGFVYRLDAGKTPKQIDIGVAKDSVRIKGIYVLDGDELRLCLAQPGKERPAAFPKKPGPGEVLILHRQVPGAEQPKAKGGPPDAKKVLTPEEAIKQMPKENVTVQFKVASVEVTGDYYGYPATYYVLLKDGGKFTAWLRGLHPLNHEDQIQKLVKKLGIESVTDLSGKVVRVTGRVEAGRMFVHDPANNVEVVKPKTDGKEQKPNEEKLPMTKEEKLRVLIDKVLAAHGGEDKLNKLTSFTMTVKHSNGETQHYFVQPPKNFRWETTHRDRTSKRIVILFPEGRRWWTKEPNEDANGFIPTGIEFPMKFWLDYVKFFGPRQVLRLKDADHKVALLDEEAKIGGRAAVGVQLTGPLCNQKMYFDKETHLLLKGVGSDILREVTFSDYKKFDGIPIAQKEHDGHFEPIVTDFRVVDKLDAKLFERP